jgi:hypothetical protein
MLKIMGMGFFRYLGHTPHETTMNGWQMAKEAAGCLFLAKRLLAVVLVLWRDGIRLFFVSVGHAFEACDTVLLGIY